MTHLLTLGRPRSPQRRLAFTILLVLIVAIGWRWFADGDPLPVELACPVQGIGDPASAEAPADPNPAERQAVQGEGVIVGRVTVRRPDGVLEGIAAQLAVHVNEGDMPTAAEIARAARVTVAADGSFVVETAGHGMTHCVAEHIDGVASYACLNASAGFLSVVLPPAGRLRLLLPGNSEAFTLLMTSARTEDAPTEGMPKCRMQATGAGPSLQVGGVPLSWGAVRLSVLFSGGARVDLRDPVALAFRQWSEISLDVQATGSSVQGVVENQRGEPVSPARVHVYALKPLGDSEYQDATTSGAGRFWLGKLRAGRYAVRISADGYLGTAEELALADNEARDLGTRVLTVGATLSGRVVAADAEGLSVSLSPAGLKSDHTIASARKCDPGPAGEFSFANVAVGSWTVAVHAKNPRPWQTAWAGCQVIVRDKDAEVVVPDIREPGWTQRAISLEAIGVTTMVGWKAVARGVGETWCSYGVVDAERTVSLQVGPGQFLFGLTVPWSDGPSLVWCGVFDSTVMVCRVPGAQVVFDCGQVATKRGYTLSVVYTGGSTWPSACLPLSSEIVHVNLQNNQLIVKHLPTGSFEIRIGFAGEVRTVPVVVQSDSSVVQCVWPF